MKNLKGKVIVVLVVDTLTLLDDKIKRLLSSGYDTVEVTLRTDCAFDVIKFVKQNYPQLSIGAGTILTVQQLEQCVELGVDFGVSPGLNREIVKRANELGFNFIPGVATASEVEEAMGLGVELVKVFPAKLLGGVEFIKALSGPYNRMKFMPTGGIAEADCASYLEHDSVYCLGGSWMVKD